MLRKIKELWMDWAWILAISFVIVLIGRIYGGLSWGWACGLACGWFPTLLLFVMLMRWKKLPEWSRWSFAISVIISIGLWADGRSPEQVFGWGFGLGFGWFPTLMLGFWMHETATRFIRKEILYAGLMYHRVWAIFVAFWVITVGGSFDSPWTMLFGAKCLAIFTICWMLFWSFADYMHWPVTAKLNDLFKRPEGSLWKHIATFFKSDSAEVRATLSALATHRAPLHELKNNFAGHEMETLMAGGGFDLIESYLERSIRKSPAWIIEKIRGKNVSPDELALTLIRNCAGQFISSGEYSLMGGLSMQGDGLKGVFDYAVKEMQARGYVAIE